MLSVLRCGFSFKFVGRDQEACWAHRGYCYESEVRKTSATGESFYARAPPNFSLDEIAGSETRPNLLNNGAPCHPDAFDRYSPFANQENT